MFRRPRSQPAIAFIFITLFLDSFGIGVVVPVLPKLIQQMQGGSVEWATMAVGLLVALYALMQFLFSPVLGSLSDHFGRRPVILGSLLGSGIDYMLLAWAPNLAWIILGRIVSGITAANYTAASAYIADVTSVEKRAAGFGVLGAAFGLGFITGPLVGGWLGEHGVRLPFWFCAGVTLLNWLYGAFVLPESLIPENRRKFVWSSAHPIRALMALRRWPLVFGLAAPHFIVNMVYSIYPSLWVLYTGYRYGWDTQAVGISLSLVGVMSALVQGGLAAKVSARIGERAGMCLGLFFMALALTAYGMAPVGWMIYGFIMIGALGGLGNPAAQSLISKEVPFDQQGAVQGALNSLTSMAGIVGPLIWTSLFTWALSHPRLVTSGLPFIAAGALTVTALGLTLRVFAAHRASAGEAAS